jgi:hypothetical protein
MIKRSLKTRKGYDAIFTLLDQHDVRVERGKPINSNFIGARIDACVILYGSGDDCFIFPVLNYGMDKQTLTELMDFFGRYDIVPGGNFNRLSFPD